MPPYASQGATVLLAASLGGEELAAALSEGETSFRVAAKAAFVAEVASRAAEEEQGEGWGSAGGGGEGSARLPLQSAVGPLQGILSSRTRAMQT